MTSVGGLPLGGRVGCTAAPHTRGSIADDRGKLDGTHAVSKQRGRCWAGNRKSAVRLHSSDSSTSRG